MSRISTRTYEILESKLAGDSVGKFFTFSIMALIAINVIAVILETVPALASQYSDIFSRVDTVFQVKAAFVD